jgi:hypothetical protein
MHRPYVSENCALGGKSFVGLSIVNIMKGRGWYLHRDHLQGSLSSDRFVRHEGVCNLWFHSLPSTGIFFLGLWRMQIGKDRLQH